MPRRLQKHVYTHYVGGRLYRAPNLHLGTLRRLTPKLMAVEEVARKGGKISRQVLQKGERSGGIGRGRPGSGRLVCSDRDQQADTP